MKSSTGARNPTLAITNIIKIRKWDVDIKAKYVTASLVTVPRIFEVFVPWCVDTMSCVCIRTNTRTKTSMGTDGWFNLRNGEVGKNAHRRRE